ncbi:VOC family protein [Microvirga guangxiensis]|uniref:Catechol 2,3-dioxygenase n=1 Tax=Microvirga guangxiensis TaxID=549386 RepID=A0A1G5IR38_9HYPH|nr:VOC family protein [Microvirga guangxiensis]SCY78089.1 catechol 2,3-dioxygenase [Microvirga guangxiensis]
MTTTGSLLAGSLAGRSAKARGTTPGVTSAGAPMRIGTVALTVRDLDTVSRFYQQVIGLTPIETGTSLVRLGVGDTVLLELRHDPDAPLASRRAAGLFHTAFLLPNRTDLAQWLLNAAERGVALQGASDHLVSEAIYLADPEGNGIEVYWDRPSETWAWQDGMVAMDTLALDLNGLVATVKSREWTGLPLGSLIGHVHLQVGALDASERFYAGLLGFEVMTRYPGATFLGSGGYHHHLGTNIWNSRGAPVRSEPTTGLADVEIVTDAGTLEAIRSRLSPEQAVEASPTRLPLHDPWGTAITVVTR